MGQDKGADKVGQQKQAGIPYRTAVAVRPPEGHLIRDARMGMLC